YSRRVGPMERSDDSRLPRSGARIGRVAVAYSAIVTAPRRCRNREKPVNTTRRAVILVQRFAVLPILSVTPVGSTLRRRSGPATSKPGQISPLFGASCTIVSARRQPLTGLHYTTVCELRYPERRQLKRACFTSRRSKRHPRRARFAESSLLLGS